MGNRPRPPDGHEEPVKYVMRDRIVYSSLIILLSIFAVFCLATGVHYVIPDDPLSNIVALLFAVSGSLFLHESAHYIVANLRNLEPDFAWPNRVMFGVDELGTKDAVASLMAPQILSILYIAIIYLGVSLVLEVILVWALAINFAGGAKDIPWTIRRLMWPRGTIVILKDDTNYVCLPKEGAP